MPAIPRPRILVALGSGVTAWLLPGCVGGPAKSAPPVALQPPPSPPVRIAGGAEAILVRQTIGEVKLTTAQGEIPLGTDRRLRAGDRITTSIDSSINLLFSNGTMLQLGPDSVLAIEDFAQDPFNAPLAAGQADREPSASRTKLRLVRGEIITTVKRLNYPAGSTFVVETPVGLMRVKDSDTLSAVGGETLVRLFFRPVSSGQARFRLSTAAGHAEFAQQSGGPGVSVPAGREIAIDVTVTTNAQGQPVVTASAPLRSG